MDLAQLIRKLQLLQQLLDGQGRESVEVVTSRNLIVTDIDLQPDSNGRLQVVILAVNGRK